MTAFDYLKTLQTEVGTRRAGTQGERRAQEWLKAHCEALGLPVELDKFAFISSEAYRPLNFLITIAWAAVSVILMFNGFQVLGGLGLVLMFVYMNFIRKKLELRLARSSSFNVIAGLERKISEYVADEEKGPAVLICAHYDTPRNFPAWVSKVRDLFRVLRPLASLGILILGLSFLLAVVNFLVPRSGLENVSDVLGRSNQILFWSGFVLVTPALLGILFYFFSVLFSKKTDSPGADDNGSGTSVVMELARRLKGSAPETLEVFFAWWGAEELGLFGSRQFVRRFHRKLDKEKFYILNVDCVGAGELLTVHAGQGVWRRKTTNPETVERLERLAAGLGIKTIRSWESPISGGSSDHAEWVDRGYRHATSFIREDYRPLSFPARIYAGLMRIPYANQLELRHIHSLQDTLDVIQADALQQTADLAEAYVRDIDRGMKNQ